MSGNMTPERAVEQLKTLIEDAESHREADGTLDQVYEDDIAALTFAVTTIRHAGELLRMLDSIDESLTAMLKECESG